MREHEGRLQLAATDLSDFLACRHLATLSREVALGERESAPGVPDLRQQALAEAGREHEEAIEAALEAEGRRIETVPEADRGNDAAEWTLALLRRGAPVVKQGVLRAGGWSGRPDYLLRVEAPSRVGAWSYEVLDAKLSRSAKPRAVMQIAVYSRLLTDTQGTAPKHMHLALGGGEWESLRVADFAAFERRARSELERHCERDPATYPEPVDHCRVCDWHAQCAARRRQDDHLSLVAGVTRRHRERLGERNVSTLSGLARLGLPLGAPLTGVSAPVLEKIHHQARIQFRGREADDLLHERLGSPDDPAGRRAGPTDGRGLLRLPKPSAGDLFFDLESAPFVGDGGLEYLFGFVDRGGAYQGGWAFDAAGEKQEFERFMDSVEARRERDPHLHIYHYGGYETGALKRLAGRYNSRAEALDDLLRQGVFVDLLQVVRQGIRASVEDYSLKSVEPFAGYARETDVREARRARLRLEAAFPHGDAAERRFKADRELAERYNADDCRATRALCGWLLEQRTALLNAVGPRAWFTPEVIEPTGESGESGARVEALFDRLSADLPEDAAKWTAEQRARRLLADLLDFHRREDKSKWWEYFAWTEMDEQQLVGDRGALGGLAFAGEVGRERRSVLHRYRFPARQEHNVKEGSSPWDPETGQDCGEVWRLDGFGGSIVLKRGPMKAARPHPKTLVPFEGIVPTANLQAALIALGEGAADRRSGEETPQASAWDLLLRRPPRSRNRSGSPDGPLIRSDELPLDAARRLVLELDRSVLPVQGPPGSGKTYAGARMITALVRAGKRVGVTAQSHRVITNLLDAVADAAEAENLHFRGLQKANREDGSKDSRIQVENRPAAVEARVHEADVIGGTAWLWTRIGMADTVDVLFVDEAGQFSLANALACCRATASLVLLGDPRQLDQVTTGVHPPEAAASALGHVLGDRATLAPDRGIFLRETWRMHPDICRFPSEQFYEGKLGARGDLNRQRVQGDGFLTGSGLRFVPIEHEGNRTWSEEEAACVQELVAGLTGSGAFWTDREGAPHPMRLADILVVAPYNDQVERLVRVLPRGSRVGTVDKFQGQEAPVVIYSMATSSPEEAPRGMEFLYSRNRLNVATSRARALAAIVASPKLLLPECRTPHQMRLANSLCRFVEMAAPR